MLTTNFFKYNASCARSPAFINLREVNGRYRLKPGWYICFINLWIALKLILFKKGRYCIIPSTFEPNSKGDFIIRFFTEKPAQHVMENDEEIGIAHKEEPVSPETPEPEDVCIIIRYHFWRTPVAFLFFFSLFPCFSCVAFKFSISSFDTLIFHSVLTLLTITRFHSGFDPFLDSLVIDLFQLLNCIFFNIFRILRSMMVLQSMKRLYMISNQIRIQFLVTIEEMLQCSILI